ncbi:MAG: hypothetical protein ACLTYN_13655 [Dysosmobacter welbionis]
MSARIFDRCARTGEAAPDRRFGLLPAHHPKLLNAYDRMSGTGVSERTSTPLARWRMMRTMLRP